MPQRDTQGTSLAELARSVSLTQLGTVREEMPSRSRTNSPECCAATQYTSDLSVNSNDTELPAVPEFQALLEFGADENMELSRENMNKLFLDMQVCAVVVCQLQRQLHDCQERQLSLSGELCRCSDQTDSMEKRVDAKLWEQSVAVQNLEKTVHCKFADLGSEIADTSLRAIDDRLSDVCSRLEGAAPVLSRGASATELPRIEGSEDEACPTLEQWGRQVTLLHDELLGAVDDAKARILNCERQCACLEQSFDLVERTKDLEQLKEQIATLAKARNNDIAKDAVIKDSVERDQYDASVKAVETRLDVMDSRVQDTNGMLADLEVKIRDEHRASFSKELLDHKEVIEKKHTDLREFLMKERRALEKVHGPLLMQLSQMEKPNDNPAGVFSAEHAQNLLKLKEEILSDLGGQYAQARDQMSRMTEEHVTRQTERFHAILGRERREREADLEAALKAAVATMLLKVNSTEQSPVVTDSDKDSAVKAGLGVLGSASTKAPTSADEDDDFHVVIRTVADRPLFSVPLHSAEVPPSVVQARALLPMSSYQPMPAAVAANFIQAMEMQRPLPSWSPTAMDYRQAVSPQLEDIGESLLSARTLNTAGQVKKDGHSAGMMSPPSRHHRHTLSPPMITRGLPQTPHQSSRRTLSPTTIRRTAGPGHSGNVLPLKIHSARGMAPVVSSPSLPSR